MKNIESSSKAFPVGLRDWSVKMHKNPVRACFSWPFFSSQGRTDTKKEPQDFF